MGLFADVVAGPQNELSSASTVIRMSLRWSALEHAHCVLDDRARPQRGRTVVVDVEPRELWCARQELPEPGDVRESVAHAGIVPHVESVKANLGEQAFDDAWKTGYRESLEDAVANTPDEADSGAFQSTAG